MTHELGKILDRFSHESAREYQQGLTFQALFPREILVVACILLKKKKIAWGLVMNLYKMTLKLIDSLYPNHWALLLITRPLRIQNKSKHCLQVFLSNCYQDYNVKCYSKFAIHIYSFNRNIINSWYVLIHNVTVYIIVTTDNFCRKGD